MEHNKLVQQNLDNIEERMNESLSKDLHFWLFTKNPVIQQDYITQLYHLTVLLQNIRIKLRYFDLYDELNEDMKNLSLKILDSIQPRLLTSEEQVKDVQLQDLSEEQRQEIISIVDKI